MTISMNLRGSLLQGAPAFWVLWIAVGLLPASAVAQDVADVAGIYELVGEMTVEGQPDHFVVTGRFAMTQDGAHCTYSVEAAIRRVEGASGPASASFIGTGEATLNGDAFTGAASMQTLYTEVAALDVAFPFAPRKVGPRFESKIVGKLVGDGIFELEVTSDIIGEGFTLPEGRKTRVRSTRVARSPTELKKK